jgi:hypothetical protein
LFVVFAGAVIPPEHYEHLLSHCTSSLLKLQVPSLHSWILVADDRTFPALSRQQVLDMTDLDLQEPLLDAEKAPWPGSISALASCPALQVPLLCPSLQHQGIPLSAC